MRFRTLLVVLLLASVVVPAAAGGDEEPESDDGTRRRPEAVALALGFGYVSPFADPHLAEGYGGGVSFWTRLYGRLGARVALDLAANDLDGDLADIPYPFMAGDVTFGPTLEILPIDSAVTWRASFGTGAYWTAYVAGLVWTWGLDLGTAVTWHVADWLGLQIEARYHLYNLADLGDRRLLDPLTLRPAGMLDRFDLFVSFVLTK